jgi:hypothetical protein
MELLGDLALWGAVDAGVAKAHNEIEFTNFVGQALPLQILTSKCPNKTPGSDEYLQLYDSLVKNNIIEKKIESASALKWDYLYKINQTALQANDALTKLKHPETLTKCFHVNHAQLLSFLKNYKNQVVDGVHAVHHVVTTAKAAVKPAVKPAVRPAVRPVVKPAVKPAVSRPKSLINAGGRRGRQQKRTRKKNA